MHVVGSEAVFPLRFSLDVLAVGMNVETVGALVEISAAPRKEHVVAPVGILEDEHHGAFARRPGPEKRPLGWVKAVHRAGAAAMHEFLVVVEIEAVEVDALAALDLLDAQDLTSAHFDHLADARLDHMLENDFVRSHASGPLLWLIAGGGVFFQR